MKSRAEERQEDEAQRKETRKTVTRPTSPDPTGSQDPERGSRYRLTLANTPFFSKSSSGMHHSASMPNFPSEEMTSPKSPSSPLSGGRVRANSKSKSPDSPASPSGRHSLFRSSNCSTQNISEEAFRTYLQASIEDAIQNALSDGYYLAEFSTSFAESTVNPGHQFHCVIASSNHNVVFKKTYSAFKLNSIDNFVEKFNDDCPLAKLTPGAITRGLDQNNFILSPLNPGFGNAVFVTGESEVLGHWVKSLRLNYNKTLKAWRLTLPEGVTDPKYKYKKGPFAEGKNPDSDRLAWEDYHGNRELLPAQIQSANRKFGM